MVICGYEWILFSMQLVSYDTAAEEVIKLVSHSKEEREFELTSGVAHPNELNSPVDTCEEICSSGIDDGENIDGTEATSLLTRDVPQCRICLDTGGDDLIAPCNCKGTQKYVHRSCLDNWRSTKEGFAFAHCTECKALFVLRANVPPERWWLRLKFQFLVVRDHTLIFFTVQLVVAVLGLLIYRVYGPYLREMFGYEEHPYAFYAMSIMSVVLVGLLYGFFIAIICGQRINERHYHVLAKQELTKEFVVEDREGHEHLPDLDPSYIAELKVLGLY